MAFVARGRGLRGYVPHQDGIELARHAASLFNRSKVRTAVEGGRTGDAAAWLAASELYREHAAVLLEEAAALEQWQRSLESQEREGE